MTSSNSITTRLRSLDVFRGITIVLMILVNSPGNSSPYSFLSHSTWNGCTLADIVFPFFIFIVGVSSVFSLSSQQAKGNSSKNILQQIFKRAAFLFFLGLLLNTLSCFGDLASVRILGVLQRIAICYLFSSLLFLTTRVQTQTIILGVLLVIYWYLLTQLASFNSISATSLKHNLIGYIDVMIFSPHHMYTSMFDPEGLLSTIPSIATALLGNLLGIFLRTNKAPHIKLTMMIYAGISLLSLGWLWNSAFPINKSIWSSSYVLWTGGLALLTYAFCYWLIELKRLQAWTKPFIILGVNALPAYVFHVVLLKIQAMIHLSLPDGRVVTLKGYITETCFNVTNMHQAALLYAISYIGFCFVVIALVYRKKEVRVKANILTA